MNPKIPITDPEFKWTPSARTDVRKTWAKARKEMKELPKVDNIVKLRKTK